MGNKNCNQGAQIKLIMLNQEFCQVILKEPLPKNKHYQVFSVWDQEDSLSVWPSKLNIFWVTMLTLCWLVYSKRFWRWYIIFRITRLLDFAIIQYSKIYRKRFGNWICFCPQVRGETPTLLGPLERGDLQWLRLTLSKESNTASPPFHLRTETDPVSKMLWPL
jgi:hypothetical protein